MMSIPSLQPNSLPKRRLVLRAAAFAAGLLFLASVLPGEAGAFPKGSRPPARASQEIRPSPSPAKRSPRPTKYKAPKKKRACKEDDRACRVDQTVDEIEIEIESVAKHYQKGNIWTIDDAAEQPRSTGGKIARDFLNVPTYIGRAITWPFAVLGHFLIQEGVIRKTVEICSNDERTFWIYPKLELGFGSGFGGGIGIRHYDLGEKNWRLNASYVVHVNLDQRGEFTLGKPDIAMIADRPVSLALGTNITHLGSAQFYGVGPTTSRSDEAHYQLDELQAGGEVGYEPLSNLFIRTSFRIIADSSGTGNESPSVDQLFPSSDLAGFDKQLVYADMGFRLLHDDRDATAAPERGGRREVAVEYFQGLGSTRQDYFEWRVNVEQFIRAWLPRHVLAFRTSWIMQHGTGAEGVPFFRLATFDVNSPARGFAAGRFHDTGRAVFNVEYRYPIWRFLDGDFFFDTGRVFHGPADFSFKHFRYSGGAGLRMRTSNYFLFRAELAYGGEGMRFLFKTSQAF